MKIHTQAELLNDPTQPVPWDADKTYLYFIAAEDDLFNRVCQYLGDHGHSELADELVRLHQDVGIEIAEGLSEDAPGPESAAILAQAKPITPERLRLLHQAASLLPDGDLREALTTLNGHLPPLPGIKPLATSMKPQH